ncbi:pilus assembly FimT family protein [Alteromonas facilis]|uniref:pilus assembly FimT family protein n=1 Tax=Alteromonas facilis TaxID=2048004 RepID=UPI000C291C2D|nr:type II secretion system protein [Alteromonas facilis]
MYENRYSKRPVYRPFLIRQRGFSFVELITVIVLIGTLSVIAVARFSGSDGFAEYTFQNRLISALRNMQQRAMQDNRLNYCYRINLVEGAVAPAFGPPSTDYRAGNQAASCAASIDHTALALATASDEIAEERVSIAALDSGNNGLTFIDFDGLGRPISNLTNCASGCRVTFSGSNNASVCIEAQGYVHAC